MMKLLPIILLFSIARSESEEKFVYTSNEEVTIQNGSMAEFSISLTTKANEYLSEANIQTSLNIQQNGSIDYNLIYFNYQIQNGQECYQNWVVSNTALPTCQCSDMDVENLPPCMNYTSCFDKNITFKFTLTEELYKQAFVMVENISNDTELVLQTLLRMELSSSNTWFYWGVGLTCLLLISLVIYAGIIFYWLLKYKRIKKMFQQFKLTEQQESIKKQD